MDELENMFFKIHFTPHLPTKTQFMAKILQNQA